MLHFCTLFDSRYASRGVAMIESLRRHCPNFHLYLYAFDEAIAERFRQHPTPDITVVALNEWEDAQLLEAKKDRSRAEYAWTATSSVIRHALNHFPVDACTYLDADLFFYSDPAVLLAELGERSILITEHRYTPVYDQSLTAGKYCVQFITFRNNAAGKHALEWWREACLKWCYARMEDGKFGDQKYLDDWPQRFDGVHVLRHLGGGVAPWNVQQYSILTTGDRLCIRELTTGLEADLVFYHFHHLSFWPKHRVDLGPYAYTQDVIDRLYRPYVRALLETTRDQGLLAGAIDPHGLRSKAPLGKKRLGDAVRQLRRWLNGTVNTFELGEFTSQ